jgi:ferritin heavy chain
LSAAPNLARPLPLPPPQSHAQKLIDFQNTRGGRVKLNALLPTLSEFNHEDKGDALFAMELSLSLERLNYQKLLGLHATLEKHADPQAAHFVEYMLEEQAEDVKKAGDYVAQLRRIGKDGHGVWHFDYHLYNLDVLSRAYAGGGDGAA